MKWMPVFCAVGAVAVITTPAFALDIINDDGTGYTVEVTQGQGSASSETFELEAGQTLTNVCGDGCTVKLDNGAEAMFAGDESVTIKDGEFVLTE